MEIERYLCPTCNATIKNVEDPDNVECQTCGLMVTAIPVKKTRPPRQPAEDADESDVSNIPMLSRKDHSPTQTILMLFGIVLGLLGLVLLVIALIPGLSLDIAPRMRPRNFLLISILILAGGITSLFARSRIKSQSTQ